MCVGLSLPEERKISHCKTRRSSRSTANERESSASLFSRTSVPFVHSHIHEFRGTSAQFYSHPRASERVGLSRTMGGSREAIWISNRKNKRCALPSEIAQWISKHGRKRAGKFVINLTLPSGGGGGGRWRPLIEIIFLRRRALLTFLCDSHSCFFLSLVLSSSLHTQHTHTHTYSGPSPRCEDAVCERTRVTIDAERNCRPATKGASLRSVSFAYPSLYISEHCHSRDQRAAGVKTATRT